MLNGNARSSHLRELLRFEAERHGLPIEYINVPDVVVGPPQFASEAVIYVYDAPSYTAELVGIRLIDEEVLVKVPIPPRIPYVSGSQPEEWTPIGYEHRGEFVELGRVMGNRLLVHLSLEHLALPGAVIARRPLNGTCGNTNVLAAVFDMVVSKAMPIIKANIGAYNWSVERAVFAAQQLVCIDEVIRSVGHSIEANRNAIDDHTRSITRLVAKNKELRARLQALGDYTRVELRKRAEQSFNDLLKMTPGALRSIRFASNELVAVTHPVRIVFGDHTFEMGEYTIKISYGSSRVEITGDTRGGYPHPHIAADGTPCLGNIGPAIAKLIAEGQYAPALTTLLQFLASFTPSDAYIHIDRWDPDYADQRYERCHENASTKDCVECLEEHCPFFDERYERCYENASTEDCVGCSEERCPFFDERYERCFNYHQSREITECIACRDCSMCHQAERVCRGESSLVGCIGCAILACSFAASDADMADCHEANPEYCADCGVSACTYQGCTEDDEEEEE